MLFHAIMLLTLLFRVSIHDSFIAMSGINIRRVGRGSNRDTVNEWARGERA